MSDEESQFKDGQDRGLAGKASSTPLDIFTMFDSLKSKAARKRGFESGVANKALADSLRANRSDASSTSGTSWISGRTFGAGELSGAAQLVLGLIYLGLLAGSFFLIQVVATWSLVWWLCVLVIISGVPVFIFIFLGSLVVIVALTVLALVVALFEHFAGNLY